MALTDGLKLPIPELTEAADGPDAFSDLANALEDYFFDRTLPTGVTRMPQYHWGSGTSAPASALLRSGDTYRHTNVGLLVWNGTKWTYPVDKILGEGSYTGANNVTLSGPSGWTNMASVTAYSNGGLCAVRWIGEAYNGASGENRTMAWRVVCDDIQVNALSGINLELANLRPITKSGIFSSTPAAGQHTWKLQAQGSADLAVVADSGLLTVIERA